LSLRELARRAGTSHATLLAYENATKVPTVATFMRVLESSGYAVDIQLSPRIRERDGLDRGEELRQVLELAEQFPARLSRTLTCPKFARQ
jgi:transcriptional regulator with XRE-family HTH domain